MSEREGELPVVDEQWLARCLRLKTWPGGILATACQRIAMRVITDAHYPSVKTGKVTPESALVNATAWIERAYKEGKKEGAAETDAAWRKRIMNVFGLEPRDE